MSQLAFAALKIVPTMLLVLGLMAPAVIAAEGESARLKVLFLGDNGHHRPAERFQQFQPVMNARGIEMTYTDRVTDLNPETLERYDALLLYANIDQIEPAQEKALLDYVSSGGGFVSLHCASYCFRNSDQIVALIGAQFQRHGTGVFRTTTVQPDHPIMKELGSFESWDETYVHTKHNESNRTVLEYRVDDEGREPWTWVRTHGKGRVFYTAWGHDERTWGNAGFQELVERGIRWAAGEFEEASSKVNDASSQPPEKSAQPADVKPFEYVDAEIAFYPPDGDRKGDGQWNKMQLPVDPQQSLKHMVTPPGFHVELFASEPQIGKPLCMNWDERGRLWIAETIDYPNELQPPGQGRDRIKICEDTDGDGRADKFTVFADQLSIPTSLAFSQGGVIVHQAPETLFLKDTDGDDKADIRQVLFRGWSTRDTHAGPSNLQYGLDNWFWGMVGYSGFSGRVGRERHNFSMGFYRFRPDGSKLEFVRSTNNNTWGLGFSEEGIVFGSTANAHPSIYMPIANRYYESVRGWSAERLSSIADSYMFKAITDKIRQVDHHGGYTAAAGHALYTARSYPPEYWNRAALVNEPTGHLLGVFLLSPDGSDFHSTNPFNLLASDDEWTAPTMAEVGPDGCVWMIDWYNYIVQHNPTPVGYETGKGAAYETDLRDKKHGRIYRIVYDAADLGAPISLAGASPQQLVAALKHDNMLWRKHAQRLLVERGQQDVLPELIALAGDTSVDQIGLNASVIHALWTMHGLGALDGSNANAAAAVVASLNHQSAGVRRAAVSVLPRTSDSLTAVLASGVLVDSDAQVRLAALLALAEMPADLRAAMAVVDMLNRPQNFRDRWIPDAAASAAAAHDIHFLKAVAKSRTLTNGTTARILPPAMLSVVGIVAQHYARGDAAPSVNTLLVELADAHPAVAGAIVVGLAQGWPRDGSVKLGTDAERALVALLPKLTPGTQGQLVNLSRAWGSTVLDNYAKQIAESLLATVLDEKQSDERRIDAAQQLTGFLSSSDSVVDQLLTIVTPRTSPTLAAGIIEALGASSSQSVAPALVKRFAGLTPAAKTAALRVMVGRPTLTAVLLDSIEKGQIQLGELTLDQKEALARHPQSSIRRRAEQLLASGGGLPNPDRQKVLEQLMPLTKQIGDVQLGKLVFKEQCTKCHTHSGEGTKIGPDLTGMAVHPKAELLTHIIDPSRSVEGNYRVYTVVTADGRILNGLLASESRTAIELYDAEGKKHVVLREDIDELVASPKSLMPEGFEKQVPPESIVNLLEFLTQRGKYMPLDLSSVATIASTRGMFYDTASRVERLVFPDWAPKTFEGVPFSVIDPQGDQVANVIMMYGPLGKFPPTMPKLVTLPYNGAAKAIHLLSGVSGWGAQQPLSNGTVSLTVRLHYADGTTEDHPLLNGEHFADYVGRFDVPGSKLAFMLRNQQIRYLAIHPSRTDALSEIEFVKGPDSTAPIVMAVTIESP